MVLWEWAPSHPALLFSVLSTHMDLMSKAIGPRVSEVGGGEERRPPNHTGRPCSQIGRAAAPDHAARREGTSREMLHQGFPALQ